MDCHEIQERISEYIDGTLSDDAAAGVKEHIDRCEGCREEFEAISAVVRHMNQLDPVEEPDDFVGKVTVRLEKKGFSLRNLFRRLFVPVRVKLPLEVAAIAVVAVLIFYVAGMRGDRDPYEIDLTLSHRPVDVKGYEKAEPPEPRGKKGPKWATSITAALDSVAGRAIETEYDDTTGELKQLVIELKAGSFPSLWRELKTIGVIEEPLPQFPNDENQVIRVTIHLTRDSR